MTLMGTAYEGDKSTIVVSRLVDAPIEEGLVVYDAGNDKVAGMANSKVPFGVMGQNEIVGASVVVAGLKVYAQADDSCTPTVGAPVYVNDAGKVTHDSSATTAINATFAEDALKNDGVVENTTDKAYDRKCVAINFVGGF